MACKCAKFDSDSGRYQCDVSGDGCIYLIPNAKKCAEEYGEGPEADYGKCEECSNYYTEDGKRCCKLEPLIYANNEFINSKYIEDEIMACGAFDKAKN